jgi:MEDS: MEthanogen/methylotroph, DcmR Sensory domain
MLGVGLLGKTRIEFRKRTGSEMTSWSRFIDTPGAADHAVHVYGDVSELATSVARFLDAGFRTGEPAIAIATANHREAFAAELARCGWDAALLERQGMLVSGDAEALLAQFMDVEAPSAERFERVVGGLVDELAARHPGRTIRAFGEMVDVLWRRGQRQAAIALEDLWNELAKTRSFALLCGYQLDIFEPDVQREALPEVLCAHSHVRTVESPSRLATAVDIALAEIVGPIRAARIYLDVAEHVPQGSLSRAQAVLGWLSTRELPQARAILERARMHYQLRTAA